ncbi:MAG TPA: hypothetical protein VMG12_08660 [Polyangiaceae bacterium]|nr:hypothetical protein [Polyangiaceae bacterium]
MKRTSWLMLGALSLGALTLPACSKKPESTEKKAETTATDTAEDKKAARPKPPPVDEGIDVPTEEDFEESAATAIKDDADLSKELDRLEKEIGK